MTLRDEREKQNMVTIKIKTDGSAFEDPFFDEINNIAKQREVSRILKKLAETLDYSAEFGKAINFCTLADINGNRVGEFRMK